MRTAAVPIHSLGVEQETNVAVQGKQAQANKHKKPKTKSRSKLNCLFTMKTPRGTFNLQRPWRRRRMELQSTENSYPPLPGRQLSPILLAEEYNQSP